MKQNPLISVIIPVYNGERYLAEAIESALAQTWEPVEIIIVDDGSTDGSADVASRFASSVKYDLQPHAGPGAARNRGARLARGDYLAFLDADDLWLKEKLKLQMAAMQGSAAFLAPLTRTVPSSGSPPRMTNLSIYAMRPG